MKTIKILKSKVNDNITMFIDGLTVYNKDYWDLLSLEVDDDFDIENDDYSEYIDIIKNM